MNGRAARVEKALGQPTMARFHAIFCLGAGFGAATGVVIGDWPGWLRHAVIVAGAGPLLLWFARVRAQPGDQPGSQRDVGEPFPLFAWPKGPLLWVGAIALCSSLCEGAMADWSAVPTPVVVLVGFGLMGIGHAIILPLAFARAANDPTTTPGVAIASVATWAMAACCWDRL